MSETIVEDISELLNNIFMKCDTNESGVVEINSLIDFLTSQDSSWQGDERIEEEFRRLLYCDTSTQLISKDHFTKSLLAWFESSCQAKETTNSEELCDDDVGEKCSSSSSGMGESSRSTSSSSTNSIEGNIPAVCFVSDGQTLTNEDMPDDMSITDSESPRASNKLVTSLENEVNSLQRKNEYLEEANNSLLSQISCLEDTISCKEKESSIHLKKLTANNQLLEIHKQKQEEAEEKLNLFADENKSVSIQLSQCERENCKLKEFISRLEKQIDSILNEKRQQNFKIQDLTEKLKTLSDLNNKTQEELESFKVKGKVEKEMLEKLVEQNTLLQSQLETSGVFVQELKSQLSAAHNELSSLQKAKIKNKLQSMNLPDDLSADNSMVFFDGNFTLDSTIPFESSLLAELQNKGQQECDCLCLKNISFSSTSTVSVNTDALNTSDAAVGTDEKRYFDSSTFALHEAHDYNTCSKAVCKDVGVNCSIKNSSGEREKYDVNCKLCHLKSKRSLKKWTILAVILLLLCFLLGLFSSAVILSHSLKQHAEPKFCLSTLFDFFHISIKYPDLQRQIY